MIEWRSTNNRKLHRGNPKELTIIETLIEIPTLLTYTAFAVSLYLFITQLIWLRTRSLRKGLRLALFTLPVSGLLIAASCVAIWNADQRTHLIAEELGSQPMDVTYGENTWMTRDATYTATFETGALFLVTGVEKLTKMNERPPFN